jgi:hypothetical protein
MIEDEIIEEEEDRVGMNEGCGLSPDSGVQG